MDDVVGVLVVLVVASDDVIVSDGVVPQKKLT